MLGIALYPDKTELEEDIQYLQLAKSLGYKKVFMSMLQIDIHDPKKSIRRLKESIQYTKQLQMLVMLDIHPMIFKYIKKKEDDLSYFHELGVDILRLDSGFSGKEEAKMTYNPYGITIDLNMSKDLHYLELIQGYCPNYQNLSASHNFYPQSYTGLSLTSFKKCSKRFHQINISTAAFITSQNAALSPWPIMDGLCTLEEHRHLPIDVQARHMKMLHCVDDIIIGNAFASKDELKAVQDIYNSPIDCLHVDFNKHCSEIEKKMVCCLHEYRGDTSEYIIRSSHNKQQYTKENIPVKDTITDICRGDILVLNNEYGQYKGEVHIALKERKGDQRINVVGKIAKEEMILLDQLKPFQIFALKEIK